MKNKILVSLIFVLLLTSFVQGQTDNIKKVDESQVAESYDRSGLTILLLDFESDKYANYIRNSVDKVNIPIKFDDNSLSIKTISSPYYRDENSSTYSGLTAFKLQVKAKLLDSRIHYKLLEFWWGIQADGSYIATNIQERGIYNATDIDVNEADASKIGRTKLGDAGEKLIGNSYILLYEFREIKTMEEVYNAKDASARKSAKKNDTEFKPVKRTKNGFKGKMLAYLYRLTYNETVQAYFFDSFVDEYTIDLEKLNAVYDSIPQPVTYVSHTTSSCEGTQNNSLPIQKTEQQLFDKLVNKGVASAVASFGRSLEQFKVKTPVVSERPIKAKIGLKEGITSDSRFFVWEYYENSKGETKTKKKAVVRSRHVHNNVNDELGQTGTTKFYQVSGGKVRNGMILQEQKDIGIGLAMGYLNYAEKGAFIGRLEYSLSQGLGSILNSPLTAFKMYFDFSFQADRDTLNSVQGHNDYKYTRFALGLSKEFYFARRFHIGFMAAYGGENATWDEADGDEKFATSMLSAGAKLGVNLFKSVQLIGTLMSYSPVGEVAERDGEGELLKTYDVGWNDASFFPTRKGLGLDVSLRVVF